MLVLLVKGVRSKLFNVVYNFGDAYTRSPPAVILPSVRVARIKMAESKLGGGITR